MNTIKKFISMALSVVMAATSLSISTFAASTNSVTKIATVKEDSVIEGVNLKITPKSAVESGSAIVLDIENAEFDEEEILEQTGTSFVDLVEYNGAEYCKPYEIKRVNDTEIQVFLGEITQEESDRDSAPYYLIPIVAVATGEGDVKVSIDSNDTVISETECTVARVTGKDGDTTAKVNKVKTFSDVLAVDTITVKENVYNTFERGAIKVRVNGGFKIADTKITVSSGLNLVESKIDVNIEKDGSYFTFDIPEEWTNTKKASSFMIDGIEIEADDEDKNYGEVKLTISGASANITKETITVGNRQDYGFEFEVLDEVPTILAGRTAADNRNLDADDFKTATVKFSELTADTWLTNRKLEFSVPEGVKIIDVDFDDVKHIKNLDDYTSITNDGTTLRINKGVEVSYSKTDDVAFFEMNLYLSIDAAFDGDVELSVAGGGLNEDFPTITIAKAKAPISISTDTTTTNLGYQTFDTKDIVITETQDGALLEDEYVVIAFDEKKFGNSELGFNDTSIDYSIDGELEIKDFKVNSGEITFKVDKSSYTEPASITISGITVGTTRSIPYGSFNIKVKGEAVINNYEDNLDNIYPVDLAKVNEKDNEDIAYFDTTDGYSFEDYVKIITYTGSYNSSVEVTIDSNIIKVNNEEYTIDTAPYIQAETASTMVPLRVVAVALFDGNVENADGSSNITFDANSKTATIFYNDKILQFQAGSEYVYVDGTKVPCDNGAKAEIVNDRLFIPYRVLGNILNVPVSWDVETKTAKFN